MAQDSATGAENRSPAPLPDRERFYREVDPLLRKIEDQEQTLILLSTEIDGLEFVLRTFGPGERDEVVGEVASRIREAAGAEHVPYQINQGCFSLLLWDCSYRQAVERAERLAAALKKPFVVAGVAYHLEGHVGISQYPSHAGSVDELVRTSAFACHLARASRSDYASFDKEVDRWERHRFRLMVDLEKGLERPAELRLAYQPLVNLKSGECEGVEGLCRWRHPELGEVAPDHFLPYVEQTSLMLPLTETTLAAGLESLGFWNAHGFEGTLSINLSPVLFRYPDLMDRLLEQFRFYNVSPERVHFEITETGIMEQPNRAINMLQEIRSKGSRISVDDFGTGHSSLAYLADLPIDIIKIDKRFIQNLSLPWGEAIVGATAMLADKLGLVSVAEGIESDRQMEKCRELGVTYGQGFHIGRPMLKKDFEKWLKARRRETEASER